MNELNIDKLGSEKVETMFEETFGEQVGRFNDISEFEAKCEREDDTIKISLTIIGLAGSPNLEDYLEGKVEDAEEITIGDDDYGRLTFMIDREDCAILNPNDYVVVYKA